jgi:hypothetical protein
MCRKRKWVRQFAQIGGPGGKQEEIRGKTKKITFVCVVRLPTNFTDDNSISGWRGACIVQVAQSLIALSVTIARGASILLANRRLARAFGKESLGFAVEAVGCNPFLFDGLPIQPYTRGTVEQILFESIRIITYYCLGFSVCRQKRDFQHQKRI